MTKKENGMAWFTETFLPSLESRMTNPKYPNSCILSEKQADVCYRYMEANQHHGDYGYFTNYSLQVGNKVYQMTFAGKYTFLRRYERK